jgi:hemerythrin-like metal-binding domain
MFKWDDKYSVGIQTIDEQHKEIFRILDKLYSLLKTGKSDNLLNEIIPELENYTIFHFQREEFYFGKFGYSESDEHIFEHEEFIKKMREVKVDLELGRISLGFDLMIYLKTWIEHHILVVDKRYVDSLKDKI